MTVLENDVISVVHVSSDSGNHFPVLFCNLHRVKHSALVFSDKVLNVCVDRHSLVCCERPDNIFHSFRNCEVYPFIVLFIKIILGVAVLITYSPQNGAILLVMAFLISPMGLPLATIWLLGKVQSLKFAIQDWAYG